MLSTCAFIVQPGMFVMYCAVWLTKKHFFLSLFFPFSQEEIEDLLDDLNRMETDKASLQSDMSDARRPCPLCN